MAPLLACVAAMGAGSTAAGEPSLEIATDYREPVTAVAFHPDGYTLAAATEANATYLWNPQSGEQVQVFAGLRNPVTGTVHRGLPGAAYGATCTAFHPDGTVLATGGSDKSVSLWDTGIGAMLEAVTGHLGPVRGLAYGPAGQVLASIGDDGTIRFWNGRTGEAYGTIRTEPGLAVAFEPEGRYLASAHRDGAVHFWDADVRERVMTLAGHQAPVATLDFHPGGRVLASGDESGAVRVWDFETGELLRVLNVPGGAVTSVAFHPFNRNLATASSGGTIRLWDTESGVQLRRLSAGAAPVLSVAFHPFARALAAAGADGTVRLWDVDRAELRLTLTVLPGGHWLARGPEAPYYNASRGAEAYLRVDFGEGGEYPLEYYRRDLKRPELLFGLGRPAEAVLPAPDIEPRPLRRWWDRWDDKAAWAWAGLLVVAGGGAVGFARRLGTGGGSVVRRFFRGAGYGRLRRTSGAHVTARGDSEALVMRWKVGGEQHFGLVYGRAERLKQRLPALGRLYLLYDGTAEHASAPNPQALHSLRRDLREELAVDLVPVWMPMVRHALVRDECAQALAAIDARYLAPGDPYATDAGAVDPNWFCGREELLRALPGRLRGGARMLVTGLEGSGRSALLGQLAGRLSDGPVVHLRCAEVEPGAAAVLAAILSRLDRALRAYGLRRLEPVAEAASPEAVESALAARIRRWARRRRPAVTLLLDDADAVLPGPAGETDAGERGLLLAVLGRLAAPDHLSLVLACERPYLSRLQRLGAVENPLFGRLEEIPIGGLDAAECVLMVRHLGLWKGIHWEWQAANRVFELSGGQPAVVRTVASLACEAGGRASVTVSEVDGVARALAEDPLASTVGGYYARSVWARLAPAERSLLEEVAVAGPRGLTLNAVPQHLADTVEELARLGLVARKDGHIDLTARLFRPWLMRLPTA